MILKIQPTIEEKLRELAIEKGYHYDLKFFANLLLAKALRIPIKEINKRPRTKKCYHCRKNFELKKSYQQFCSDSCRQNFYKDKNQK